MALAIGIKQSPSIRKPVNTNLSANKKNTDNGSNELRQSKEIGKPSIKPKLQSTHGLGKFTST
jgi:hypothetical protein